MLKTSLMNVWSFSHPLIAIDCMIIGRRASSSSDIFDLSAMNAARRAAKPSFFAASSKLSPLFAALNAASRTAMNLSIPSFTTAAMVGATAESSTSGFFMISASAAARPGAASASRIFAPALTFSESSMKSMSSEYTMSATKFFTSATSAGFTSSASGCAPRTSIFSRISSGFWTSETSIMPSPSDGLWMGRSSTLASIPFISPERDELYSRMWL